MALPMESCPHDRVVRLTVQGTDHWICNICNTEFIEKSAVNYKIAHLTKELSRAIREGSVTFDQAAGMWREESI